MAQGRSTKIISMIKWIRTSRLSKKNSLSLTTDLVLISERERDGDVLDVHPAQQPPALERRSIEHLGLVLGLRSCIARDVLPALERRSIQHLCSRLGKANNYDDKVDSDQ